MTDSRPVASAIALQPYLPLHFHGNRLGKLEAECRFSGQNDLLLPSVGRSRGSRTGTQCCTNESSLAPASKTSDEGSATGSAANEGRGAFPLALEVATDRTCFYVVCVTLNSDRLEDKPQYSSSLEAPLGDGFNNFA